MFERQDWELFRTLDGLSAKAGVPRDKIASLVAKELMDNALDESESCDMGLLDDNTGFFVQDNGPGIDPAQVSSLFSIKRPLKSTKLLRLPSCGALGNGLRVVASAVLASGGTLRVYTKGQVMNLIPCSDGTTTLEVIGNYDGEGTEQKFTSAGMLAPSILAPSCGRVEPKCSQEGSTTRARPPPGGTHQ